MRLELRYAHPLFAHIDATASFLLDYVPDPPEPGIESYDTTLTLGIHWKPLGRVDATLDASRCEQPQTLKA